MFLQFVFTIASDWLSSQRQEKANKTSMQLFIFGTTHNVNDILFPKELIQNMTIQILY